MPWNHLKKGLRGKSTRSKYFNNIKGILKYTNPFPYDRERLKGNKRDKV